MNQPSAPVLTGGQVVRLTVLGGAGPVLTATVVDMTGPAVRLNSAVPLATGTPVQLEGADVLLLGDVCYADQAPEGYTIGLTARHMLTALAELERLGRALRREQQPVPVESLTRK